MKQGSILLQYDFKYCSSCVAVDTSTFVGRSVRAGPSPVTGHRDGCLGTVRFLRSAGPVSNGDDLWDVHEPLERSNGTDCCVVAKIALGASLGQLKDREI